MRQTADETVKVVARTFLFVPDAQKHRKEFISFHAIFLEALSHRLSRYGQSVVIVLVLPSIRGSEALQVLSVVLSDFD